MNRKNPESGVYLRSALVFFIAWIGVVLMGIREFHKGRLLPGLFHITDGNPFPLLLVCSSVVLLALFIRSAMLYIQARGRQ